MKFIVKTAEGEKGKGFIGTIIKDIWTITRGGGNGRQVGRAGVMGRGGGKGRKLYLNNNKKKKGQNSLILFLGQESCMPRRVKLYLANYLPVA